MGRMNARLDTLLGQTISTAASDLEDVSEAVSSAPNQDDAPVLMIRDAAANIGIGSPEQAIASHSRGSDVISKTVVAYQHAYDLVCL